VADVPRALHRTSGVAALLLVAALAVPASAATPKSGGWKGRLKDPHSGRLSFKVSKSKRKLTKFKIPAVVVVCGLDIRTVTVGVPSARVSSRGRFRRTYKLRDPDPSLEATYRLKGRFTSRRRASGQVNVRTTSCNVTIKFSARPK
jgi:hypothetical protein